MPLRSAFTADPRIVWPAADRPESAIVFVQNTIDIAASPQTVWSLLVNCTAWPKWYKHCSDVSMLAGESVLTSTNSQFRFKTLRFYFEPVIATFEPYRMLVWSAKGPAGTSGAHAWHIEPTETGCRVVTEEAQKGALLRLVKGQASNDLFNVHEEWLRALREMAQAG